MPAKQPAAKGGKGKKKGGAGADIAQAEEDPLHAVILADSYNSRFQPLTLDKPRCLLPLVNAPLIDWTLEALALAGVQHTYVLARSHVDLIRKHVASRMDSHTITVIATPEARSVGDAMRELDTKSLVKSDFLLVHADGVGNMDLAEVIRIHKERRKADRDAIITMCAMPSAPSSRARPSGDLAVYCLQPDTMQLLHYEALPAVPRKKNVLLPAILFDESKEVEFRNDLVDCGVDVCSVDVPPLFSENFDYQDLRRDFVTGILTSDLLESKIYVHVAPPSPHAITSAGSSAGAAATQTARGWGYAARAKDLRAYDAISRDVISRRLTPLGPGGNMPGGCSYSVKSGQRYIGADVHLSRSCTVEAGTLLGPGCRIGEGVQIRRSVIGPNVHIQDGAHITDSYIWGDCRIGHGARIEHSILAEGVEVQDGGHVGRGSVIGQHCVIGAGAEIPPCSRVASVTYEEAEGLDDSDDEGNSSGSGTRGTSSIRLGAGGKGYLWPLRGQEPDNDDEDDYEKDEIEYAPNRAVIQLDDVLDSVDHSDDELSSIDGDSAYGDSGLSDDEDGDSATTAPPLHAGVNHAADMKESFTLSGSEATAGEKAAAHQRLLDFHDEALASLSRAFDEGHQLSNISIELKTLRMSSNVPPKEVCATVVAFTLSKCDAARPKQTLETMDRWGQLIASVAADDEVEAIAAMQSYCAAFSSTHARLFVPLLKKWYNDDIVSEDGILNWYKSVRSSTPPDSLRHLLAHPQLSGRAPAAGDDDDDGDGAAADGASAVDIDAQEYAALKKQGHEVILFLLEDSDDEEEEDDEEESE